MLVDLGLSTDVLIAGDINPEMIDGIWRIGEVLEGCAPEVVDPVSRKTGRTSAVWTAFADEGNQPADGLPFFRLEL
ncbi:hypothetical protein AR276_19420 [Stenotrophomonas maltophilia]|nr:hypothetical protein AR276_19420 [Stenotrophomonas maltophilia]